MNFETKNESQTEFEGFDAAPYPFAVILGATTLLLLITTVRSLWLLATV